MSNELTRKLEFTEAIERQAIRLILHDHNFVVKWKGRLKAEHFTEIHLQVLFRVIDSYTSLFVKKMTDNVIYQELDKYLSVDDNRAEFILFIQKLLTEKDCDDDDYIRLCLMEHMEAVDYDNFLIESARLIRDGERNKVPQLLSDLTVRHTHSQPTDAYCLMEGDSVSARVKDEIAQKPAIGTPWVTLNNNHGGGLHPGTVTAFMGPTGSGKSIALVNCGANYLEMGKNVYHFTFELSELKTKARYDVCLTGCSYAERQKNPGLLDEALKTKRDKGMGKLYVISLPTGTCSAKMVSSVINDHILLGAPRPDVLILDYMTIMAPNDVEHVDMKREYAVLKKIAEEVRALAMMLNIPIITAIQANRGAAAKEKIGKEDIADSYAVMHVLDTVLSICQSDAEKQASKMRLFLAKARDYVDGYSIVCDVEYGTLRIKEDVITTTKYHNAIQKKREEAMTQVSNAGIHRPLPPEITDGTAPNAGMESLIGLGKNPIKAGNATAHRNTSVTYSHAPFVNLMLTATKGLLSQ